MPWKLTYSNNSSFCFGILNALGMCSISDVARYTLFVTKPVPGKWFTCKEIRPCSIPNFPFIQIHLSYVTLFSFDNETTMFEYFWSFIPVGAASSSSSDPWAEWRGSRDTTGCPSLVQETWQSDIPVAQTQQRRASSIPKLAAKFRNVAFGLDLRWPVQRNK